MEQVIFSAAMIIIVVGLLELKEMRLARKLAQLRRGLIASRAELVSQNKIIETLSMAVAKLAEQQKEILELATQNRDFAEKAKADLETVVNLDLGFQRKISDDQRIDYMSGL